MFSVFWYKQTWSGTSHKQVFHTGTIFFTKALRVGHSKVILEEALVVEIIFSRILRCFPTKNYFVLTSRRSIFACCYFGWNMPRLNSLYFQSWTPFFAFVKLKVQNSVLNSWLMNNFIIFIISLFQVLSSNDNLKCRQHEFVEAKWSYYELRCRPQFDASQTASKSSFNWSWGWHHYLEPS